MHNMTMYKWYRIRHKGTHQRYDRKSEMQYLGVVKSSTHTGRLEHSFNARPTAGTQSLHDDEIISLEEIPEPNSPYVAARW